MTKYYNNKTLEELNSDLYWQEFTKDMRSSWTNHAFVRCSKLRKEYIGNFASCPWQNLIRVYKFLKMVIKTYTCPIMDKLLSDCLTEIKKRKANGDLTISNERKENLTDENNRSEDENGNNRLFLQRNSPRRKPSHRRFYKLKRLARNLFRIRLHREFSAVKYTRKPYCTKRSE